MAITNPDAVRLQPNWDWSYPTHRWIRSKEYPAIGWFERKTTPWVLTFHE